MTLADAWGSIVAVVVLLVIFLYYYARVTKKDMKEVIMELKESLFGPTEIKGKKE